MLLKILYRFFCPRCWYNIFSSGKSNGQFWPFFSNFSSIEKKKNISCFYCKNTHNAYVCRGVLFSLVKVRQCMLEHFVIGCLLYDSFVFALFLLVSFSILFQDSRSICFRFSGKPKRRFAFDFSKYVTYLVLNKRVKSSTINIDSPQK